MLKKNCELKIFGLNKMKLRSQKTVQLDDETQQSGKIRKNAKKRQEEFSTRSNRILRSHFTAIVASPHKMNSKNEGN